MSGWLFKKKSITMHSNMNVKFRGKVKLFEDAECSGCPLTGKTGGNVD
jgi:hypothetical protein